MRLHNYLNENKNFDLHKIYNELNKSLFEKHLTKLPNANEINLQWNNRLKATPAYQERIGKNKYRLDVATKYKWTEDKLKGVLVHEMTHLYFDIIGKGAYGMGHGQEFQNIIKTLQKHTDFDIPIKQTSGLEREEPKEKKKSPKRGIILAIDGDNYGIGVFQKKFFDNRFEDLKDTSTKIADKNRWDDIIMGYSNHEKLNKYEANKIMPWRLFQPINNETAKEIENEMKVIYQKEN